MLLPINTSTPLCKVLDRLNKELLHFFKKAINRSRFSPSLFLNSNKSPCYINEPTRKKFEAVFNELKKLLTEEKQNFYNSLYSAQVIDHYFRNLNFPIPHINENLYNSIRKLTSHLFNKTKDLADTINVCKESIDQHFRKYVELNGLICKVCGLVELSQDRSNIDNEEQWRADYDHLLASSKYPLFAVHPKNFFPTCHICNSKAKGSKDLITDKNDSNIRRLAFYPYEEQCHSYISFVLNNDSPQSIIEFDISFKKLPSVIESKIAVWEEIYQVPQRVKSLVNNYQDFLAEDYDTNTSLQEFRQIIQKKLKRLPRVINNTPRGFWKLIFYKCLSNLDNLEIDSILQALKQKLSGIQDDCLAIYGI